MCGGGEKYPGATERHSILADRGKPVAHLFGPAADSVWKNRDRFCQKKQSGFPSAAAGLK